MQRETLARNSELYVNTGVFLTAITASSITEGASAPTWTRIENLTALNPQRSKTKADAGDFDNGGNDAHVVTSRGLTLGATYKFMVDSDDDSRPAGQEALEELTDEIGTGAIGQFKWVIVGSPVIRIFEATADMAGPGGGVGDLGSVTFNLESTGAVYKGTE